MNADVKCSPNSITGNYTIAVVKASEDYGSLRVCLGNVIREVNSLITKGTLEVNGVEVDLEFLLGGDYKVQWLYILGA